jgi:hypothetical protein
MHEHGDNPSHSCSLYLLSFNQCSILRNFGKKTNLLHHFLPLMSHHVLWYELEWVQMMDLVQIPQIGLLGQVVMKTLLVA